MLQETNSGDQKEDRLEKRETGGRQEMQLGRRLQVQVRSGQAVHWGRPWGRRSGGLEGRGSETSQGEAQEWESEDKVKGMDRGSALAEC